MTTQIQPLPTPPQPSDTPSDFNSKAFSLLGALPNFVTQANTLGGEMTVLGANAYADAQAAAASATAAGQSAGAAAGSATAAGNSAGQAAGSAGAANQSKLDAQAAAQTATNIAGGMEAAIALANTFTVIPATNQGPMIVVTQPHLRFMVWDGARYVRAPWHRPGVLFHSHGPAAGITHGIQVRSDVTYNAGDHPDLAEYLGVTGSTFVLPDGRARVLRAADNGRGIDAALVNGYLQEDAIRNFTGGLSGYASGLYSDTLATDGVFGASVTAAETVLRGSSLAGSGRMTANIDASRQVPTAAENRVKSLVATLYITR